MTQCPTPSSPAWTTSLKSFGRIAGANYMQVLKFIKINIKA
jgi:hypothetical protein